MSGIARLSTFLTELKRRHVLRVVVGYAAVGFATVSIASDFLPALRLPDWTVTLVASLVLLGFPVAAVLAWAFDVTSEGVRRSPATSETDAVEPPPIASSLGARRKRRTRVAAIVTAGLLVVLGGSGLAWRWGFLPNGGSTLPSVAVLPFQTLSPDPENDYFSAGIHEDVMTQLYKLGGVNVISRTSVMQYRGTSKSIRTVGEELGVSAILEASVRREGTRLRIDARLIDAGTDRQLWAESYDREMREVLVIQAEIAQEIATALHARLSPSTLTQLAETKRRAVDPQMYEAYLRGLYASGEGRHREGIDAFAEALRIDPTYAPAHAAIARSYYSLGFFGHLPPGTAFGRMRDAATRALQLDPDLADAHATLALFHLHYSWDWGTADQHFRRALKLSPNHAQVRHDYAHYLLAVGRIDHSVRESARATVLDPGNMMLRACAGWHDFTDREYETAVRQASGALGMSDPFWPEIILGWAYQHQGRHGEAIASLRNAVTHSGGSAFALSSLAQALGKAGERTPARGLLADLLERSRRGYVSAYDIALVQASVGDPDASLHWLELAYEERSAMLVNVGWDPRFDEMRTDPRFMAVIDRMGLPERPAPRRRPAGQQTPAYRGM